MKILEMKKICKAFGGEKALNDVDFTVKKGEIHALLGENGAGKSTLMNILTGVVPMDSGLINYEDQWIINPTIKTSGERGIAFVHQELNLINDLKVFENVFLCREITRKHGSLDKKQMIEETRKLFERLGVSINPDTLVSNLKTSEKQLLEICKALYFNANLFILDEPTTALSNDEIDHLFSILRDLKKQGKSFIFISHKMPEIFVLADSFTVLRNGEKITSGAIKDVTPGEVTRYMVGENYANEDVYKPRELGDPILELDRFTGDGFSNISLEVKKGEILAFTGLAGSGASELLHCIFGDIPYYGGRLKVKGKEVKRDSIEKAMYSGIGLLPTNRNENSVIPDLSILENIYLSEHILSKKKQHIKLSDEVSKYDNLKKQMNIKAHSPFNPITSLSGGNQQKVFIARWINTDAEVLLLDNPTQGVDVGAKEEIYKLILKFASQGKTIIFNTLETPEIQKIADRCAVFYEGEIIKIFEHDEITDHDIMLYSTNAVNTTEVV